MPNYGDPIYWDERYAKNESNSMFDWLEDFSSLKKLLTEYVKPTDKILMVGCGNANFSEDMYDAGYHYIYNIDISSVCITQMQERNKKRKHMLYQKMDCCDLKYEDNFFDVAIDKSTIDAILCGDNAYLHTALMLKEGQRVLKEGGYYIAISYGKPNTRSLHFERKFLSWNLKEFQFYPTALKEEESKKKEQDEKDKKKDDEDSEDQSHYIYVCHKQPDWREVYQKNFEPEIIKLILHEKNLALIRDDDDEEAQTDYSALRVALDIQTAKIKAEAVRSKSK